jgi:hypothetical protein
MPALTWSREAIKVRRRMQRRRATDMPRHAADPLPVGQRANLRPLVVVPNGYRVRFGDWRVSFRVDRDSGIAIRGNAQCAS